MGDWMYQASQYMGFARYMARNAKPLVRDTAQTVGLIGGSGNIAHGTYASTEAYDGRNRYAAATWDARATVAEARRDAVVAAYNPQAIPAQGLARGASRGIAPGQVQGDDGPLVAAVVQGIAELGQLENDPRLRGQTQRIVEAMRIDAGSDGRYNLSQGMGMQIAGRDIRVPAGSYTPAELANQIAPQFGASANRDAALRAAFGGQAQAPAAGQGAAGGTAQPAAGGQQGAQTAAPAQGGAGAGGTSRPSAPTAAGVEPIDKEVQKQLQGLGLETQGSKYYAAVEQAKKEGKDPSTVEMDGMKGGNTTKAIITAQRAIKEKHPEVDVGPEGQFSPAFKAALDAHAAELATAEGKTLLDKHRSQTGAAPARQAAATPRAASPTLASLDPADQAALRQATLTALNEPLNLGTGGQTVQTNDAPIGPNRVLASNDLGAGSRA